MASETPVCFVGSMPNEASSPSNRHGETRILKPEVGTIGARTINILNSGVEEGNCFSFRKEIEPLSWAKSLDLWIYLGPVQLLQSLNFSMRSGSKMAQ
ncbi:hypothetical protein SLA2020_203780 [Shorea laevis]